MDMNKQPTVEKPKKKCSGLKLGIFIGLGVLVVAAAIIGVFVGIEMDRRTQYDEAREVAQELANGYVSLTDSMEDINVDNPSAVNTAKLLSGVTDARRLVSEHIATLDEKSIIKDDEKASEMLNSLKSELKKFDNMAAVLEESLRHVVPLFIEMAKLNDNPDDTELFHTIRLQFDALPELKYQENIALIAAVRPYIVGADDAIQMVNICQTMPRNCNESVVNSFDEPLLRANMNAGVAKYQNDLDNLEGDEDKLANKINEFGRYLTDKSNGK
jgi:hypothetical protein